MSTAFCPQDSEWTSFSCGLCHGERLNCQIRACAHIRGVSVCTDCHDFPCVHYLDVFHGEQQKKLSPDTLAAYARPRRHDSSLCLHGKKQVVSEAISGFLWLDASGFAEYGGWCLDTQFMRTVGSSYLLAAGTGTPVKDAVTRITVSRNGSWQLWVRCKDWIPEYSPGKFQVRIDGKDIGRVAGASGTKGWHWEHLGCADLCQGEHELTLHDLTGYYARCSSLILTDDAAYCPQEGLEEFAAERRRLLNLRQSMKTIDDFEVAVIGGGPAGMAAAVASARTGAKTALIHNRPVLGGNASSEMGILTCGASVHHENSREGGLNEEMNLHWRKQNIRHSAEGRPQLPTLSEAYCSQAEAEPNLTVFYNEEVNRVEMRNDHEIAAVICQNALSLECSRFTAKIFIDCTGDAWVGHFAGAEERIGRESQEMTQEKGAPAVADRIMMSACLMGNGSLGYRAEPTPSPVPYAAPQWAARLPDGFQRWVPSISGQWWLEHDGQLDEIDYPEEARDELIRISFAYWGWLKNDWPEKAKAANFRLAEVSYFLAKREGRRLVGDYVLTSNDILKGEMFADRIAYGGWSLDVHDPHGVYSKLSSGWGIGETAAPVHAPIYSIPYRCLYSRNIDNLMMAGRCQSVTHQALGSVRVEATLSTLGQAAGSAAAFCVQLHNTPRDFGAAHIQFFQQYLLKNDQYIPGIVNQDTHDLARKLSKASASSTAPGSKPENVLDGIMRNVDGVSHAWISASEAPLPQTLRLDFPMAVTASQVRIVFDTDLTPRIIPGPMPKSLVRKYVLEALTYDGHWQTIADEQDNFLRLRVHDFPKRMIQAIRLTIQATYGDPQARIFEVRVY